MSTFRFRRGQQVELLPSVRRSAATGGYEIIALLPLEGDGPKYRVKGSKESHERIVSERDLLETVNDAE